MGQPNHKVADLKANISVILFLPNTHFFSTILGCWTNGTFAKLHNPMQNPSFGKEPFCAY